MPASANLKKHLPFLIYLIGMVPLGYFQSSVRGNLGDPLAFAVAIGYLIALRFLGIAMVQVLGWREKVAIEQHNAAVAGKKAARAQSRLAKENET